MTPSWYDLLGVEPDATDDEVRGAWRESISGLDPTDRRFTVLNEAASVLLDPARRAAYDGELAAAAPAPAAADDPAEDLAADPAGDPVDHPGDEPEDEPEDESGGGRRHVPAWVLVALAVLALGLAGTAVAVATTVPSDDDVAASTREAQAAAERAIVPVLSYDHRRLEEDRAEAVGHLTDDFREDYEQLFSQIEENAPSTRTVVEADVRASAITRGGHDRAQVLLLVDQVTTNAQTSEPVTYRNQVTVTMERDGDRWLVDDLQTAGR